MKERTDNRPSGMAGLTEDRGKKTGDRRQEDIFA